MKILQVSNFFKPMWETGGVTRVSYEISKNLRKKGHEVTVYTTNMGQYPTQVETNRCIDVDGLQVYYFESLKKYFQFWKMFHVMFPYYLPVVARKEMKHFDVIQLHEHRSFLAVIIHHYAMKYRIPYIVQTHGSLPLTIGNSRMKRAFDRVWGKTIIEDAAKVIALNQTEADEFRKIGVTDEKIEILPNGINLSEYDTLPGKGQFREKYGIGTEEKVVLYVGRVAKPKGIELLIRSFAEVSAAMDNTQLVLIGPQYGYTEELDAIVEDCHIEDRVRFTGFVEHEDKMAAFTDADVFVTPSFTGFPITFMEACLCGLPIITTNKGDILDWIDNKTGYVVDFDQKALGDATLRLLSDDDLNRQFGEEAKRAVLTRFNWNTIVTDLEEMYHGVI